MKKISALVTIYHPDQKVRMNMASLAEQVDRVILCDNSDNNNKEIFDGIKNCTYIPFLQNFGISIAFNKVLTDKKFEWNDNDILIFFDQDSSIESHHIKKLYSRYLNLKEKGINVGCIGPIFFNKSNNQIEEPRIKRMINDEDMVVKSIITSSMLCSYEDIKKIGFWNENLFLDMADWDISWRFQKYGYVVMMTRAVTLFHVSSQVITTSSSNPVK